MSEYQTIFSYLKSLNCHFSETWVKECVDYYKSNDPRISIDKLKSEVLQQWLLVDLRIMKVSSLPPNLSSHNKIILPGRYAVQVEEMIDASESCYSQLQRLKKVNTENTDYTELLKKTENDIKPKRCLVFTICDGVQELKAMEYQQISSIKTNDPDLLPGFKMIIIGPVDCRKGMILLKQENVKLCGGEVDTLCISNNLKSLLLKRLDLEDDSQSTDDNLGNAVNDAVNMNENEPGNAALSEDDQNLGNLLEDNNDILLSLSFDSLPCENANNDVEMHDLQQSPINEPQNTNAIRNTNITNPTRVDSSIPSFLNTNTSDDDIIITNISLSRKNSEEISKTTQKVSTSKKPVQSTLTSFLSQASKKPKTEISTSSSHQKESVPVVVNHAPFVYLKQIKDANIDLPKIFTVKAVISTLTTKIAVKNDEFTLRGTISDGSLLTEVTFSSEVLEGIIGYSTCEFISMKRSANRALADRLMQSFKNGQKKLISLNCLMNVRFQSDSLPCVLSLEEITLEHLNALKSRSLHKW